MVRRESDIAEIIRIFGCKFDDMVFECLTGLFGALYMYVGGDGNVAIRLLKAVSSTYALYLFIALLLRQNRFTEQMRFKFLERIHNLMTSSNKREWSDGMLQFIYSCVGAPCMRGGRNKSAGGGMLPFPPLPTNIEEKYHRIT